MSMAASLALVSGNAPAAAVTVFKSWRFEAVATLSFTPMTVPSDALTWMAGSARGAATPYVVSDGPTPRMSSQRSWPAGALTTKPLIIAASPLPATPRVELLTRLLVWAEAVPARRVAAERAASCSLFMGIFAQRLRRAERRLRGNKGGTRDLTVWMFLRADFFFSRCNPAVRWIFECGLADRSRSSHPVEWKNFRLISWAFRPRS